MQPTLEGETSFHTQTEPSTQLQNYQFAKDRNKIVIKPPTRYDGADFVGYALNCFENENYIETNSYKQAINFIKK